MVVTRHKIWSALAALCFVACTHAAPPVRSPAAETARPETAHVRQDVEFLARRALEGRRAGTPGSDSAANFIAQRLSDLGTRAAFTGPDCQGGTGCRLSYFQLFRMDSIVAVNVGAIIVGSDPSLQERYVAITAHYDHLGRGNGGMRDPAPNAIHPGADDNASGTSAMLELARRLSARPPRRSVIILAFGAEELGLIGSRVFVEHAPFELHDIDVALNLDMVGRLRDAHVLVFGAESANLRTLLDSANVEPRLSLTVAPRSSGRSDDFSFASHGVPALHFSTGEHADYHRATDTADRIEFDGLVRVTDFVERVARAAADRPRPR